MATMIPDSIDFSAYMEDTDAAHKVRSIVERVARDPDFAKALLDEAATLFLSGEPDAARVILRDLVNATVGFERLAELTHKPSKSLHRMLSSKGRVIQAWTTWLPFSVRSETG